MNRKNKTAESGAFEKLFDDYVRPLTLYAIQILGDQGMAEDVVQDVFLYIYERKEVYPVGSHKEHFLYNLVRNRCLNRIEQQKVRREKNPDYHRVFDQLPEDPLQLLSVIEFEHRYLQAVEKLPFKCRRIFEMSRFGDKKNQEIADELGLSKRTVETYITKSLRILRKKLKRYL